MRYANTSVWVWEGVRWEGSGDLGWESWEWEVRDYDTAGHHRYTTSDLVFGSGYFEPCVSFVFRMCSWYFRGIMDYRKVSLLMVVLVHVVSMFVCAFV